MEALGIVGSPGRGGNTELLMKHTLETIAKQGIETELLSLVGKDKEGMDRSQEFGRGMAFLLKKLNAS